MGAPCSSHLSGRGQAAGPGRAEVHRHRPATRPSAQEWNILPWIPAGLRGERSEGLRRQKQVAQSPFHSFNSLFCSPNSLCALEKARNHSGPPGFPLTGRDGAPSSLPGSVGRKPFWNNTLRTETAHHGAQSRGLGSNTDTPRNASPGTEVSASVVSPEPRRGDYRLSQGGGKAEMRAHQKSAVSHAWCGIPEPPGVNKHFLEAGQVSSISSLNPYPEPRHRMPWLRPFSRAGN